MRKLVNKIAIVFMVVFIFANFYIPIFTIFYLNFSCMPDGIVWEIGLLSVAF